MSLETGLILAFAIVGLGAIAMTVFALWLRSCENDKAQHEHDTIKHA
jgi:hypothetical protein